jgi:WD40 repeat protein
MTRISQSVALVCATAFLFALVATTIEVAAQEKKVDDKKVEKKADDKDKKDDKKADAKDKDKKDDKKADAKDKDKKDDKKADAKDKKDEKKDEKKEEKKKEEYKPDQPQIELKGHKAWVYAVRFGDDGKTLASVGRDDRTAKLWDLGTKQELASLKGTSDKMDALAYQRGIVYVVDSDMIKTKVTEKGKDKEKDKEKEIKVREYEIRVWDAKSGKQGTPLKGHTDWIRCLAIDRDGKTLYSGSEDQTVIVWDAQAGKQLNTIKAHTQPVMGIAVSKDGNTIATASLDGSVKLWDKAGKELAAFKLPEKEIKKDDPKTKKPVVTKESPRGYLCVAFSPDGKRVAAGNYDGFVKIWDVDGKKELQELKLGEEYAVWSLAYNADGSRLATGSYGGIVKLWDPAGKDVRTIKAASASRETITTVAFSPDGNWLASGALDGLIKVWAVGK